MVYLVAYLLYFNINIWSLSSLSFFNVARESIFRNNAYLVDNSQSTTQCYFNRRFVTRLFDKNYATADSTTASNGVIVSPFDSSRNEDNTSNEDDADDSDEDYELPLTVENVEKVLDEMRPYLKSDGGDVRLAEIDGPIVKLELVGACGTCPSSSMTMKLGLERKLKERIPEIAEVVQTLPDAPQLNEQAIQTVLDGVRPFLAVAGGSIDIVSISGVGGLQPVVTLKMDGTAAALQSVKLEIMQRIQRHFMMSLRIEWAL